MKIRHLALAMLSTPLILTAKEPASEDRAAVEAIYRTGYNHYGAQGVEQDVAKALECWEQAAELGHGRAASSSGMAYLSGEGVKADPVKGRRLIERAVELNDPYGLVVMGELHYRDGHLEKAKECWKKVAAMKPVGETGQPTQPSGEMAAQQGADLLKLIDWRKRKREPGKFALIEIPHIHQGHNNCGATSCAMVARHQGVDIGGWDFKKLCPSRLGTGTDWDHLRQASDKLSLSWKLITFAADDAGFREGETFLRQQLDAGRPVIIDFKFYGDRYPGGEAGHTLNLVGYIAEQNLYILCNPAIASPGLNLITREDLERYWRSDGYSHLAKKVMSRPLLVKVKVEG